MLCPCLKSAGVERDVPPFFVHCRLVRLFFEKSFSKGSVLPKYLDTQKGAKNAENAAVGPTFRARSGKKSSAFTPKLSSIKEGVSIFTFVSTETPRKSCAAAPRKCSHTLKFLGRRAEERSAAPRRNKSRIRWNKSGTCCNFSRTFFAARRPRRSATFAGICQKRAFFNIFGRPSVAHGDGETGVVDFFRFSRPSRTVFYPLSLHDKREKRGAPSPLRAPGHCSRILSGPLPRNRRVNVQGVCIQQRSPLVNDRRSVVCLSSPFPRKTASPTLS